MTGRILKSRPTRERGGLLTLIVCLLVVAVITVTGPDPVTDTRRAWDDVAVGAWGQMDHASVRVDGVQTTRTATTPSGRTLDSAAVFVVVAYTAAVTEQTVRFTAVVLRTRDDHDYAARTEFGGVDSLQPGFTRRATLVFEVPADRVDGAILVVEPDGAAFDVYSRAIRIDLRLGPEPVTPRPVSVEDSVVGVTP